MGGKLGSTTGREGPDAGGMRKIIRSSVFLLVALACIPAAGQASTRSAYSADTESQVRVLLNGIRHEHGLSSLTGSIALRNAARSPLLGHAEARLFSRHNSPKEGFSKRIRRYPLDSPLVGENIAWGHGPLRHGQRHRRHVDAPPPSHRHLILMPSLHRVGLGIATGNFRGSGGAIMATGGLLLLMAPMTTVAALARSARHATTDSASRAHASAAHGRARARGAGTCVRRRAPRTGLSEMDVVTLLERQGIGLTVQSLRRAESTGAIALSLAACLADVYGTTTDGLAGRRVLRMQAVARRVPDTLVGLVPRRLGFFPQSGY